MKTKYEMISSGVGLWASGMLIGANLVDIFPIDPSWPSWLLLLIGVVVGCYSFFAFYRLAGKQNPKTG